VAKLGEAIAGAVAGRGQTIVLGGEAGVGKTKFVREAQTRAAAAGARTLLGLTRQSDGALPYAPFISAIRSGFHGLERDELGRVLQRSAPDLAELFPELGRIERASTPTGLERHRLTVAFQHLFRAFTREAPVLLVLEDLHWADETSLELLLHLARELRDARVLILATYRSDEMHRRHPFLRTLAELQRERLVTDIALKRLTPEETGELMRAAFAATDPNVTVSNEFRDAIYARSEGNPFFTEELMKALVESGGVFWREGDGWARKPIAELEIPGTIREAVRARVEQLSDVARETLSAASVIGHRFSFEVLRDVTSTDERALETQIREFMEQQLVAEASESEDEYAFRHALTREVIHDDLLVRERKRLHRAVAEALSKRKTPPAILAHHLLAAGENARAVPVLLEAGRLALRASAPREAVAHYERVLEIEPSDDQLAGILEQLAEAYQLFDVARSMKAAEEAATVYEQRGDRLGQSRALRLASRDHWLLGAYVPANRLADRAVAVLAEEPSVELARALTNLAGLHMLAGKEDAIPIADRAIELAERFADTWALSNALVSKGTALIRADLAQGMELVERGRKLAIAAELTTTAMRAWNNAAISQPALGIGPAERLSFAQAGVAWGTERGLETEAILWLLNATIEPLIALGRWDEALRTIDIVAAHPPGLSRTQRVHLGMARSGPQSCIAEVAAMLEFAARPDVEPQGFVPLALESALVRALTGDVAGARELMSRVCAKAREDEPVRFMLAGPWHALALAVAYETGMREIVDIVADANVKGPANLMTLRLVSADAARALLDGDLESAGATLNALLERQRALWGADNDGVSMIVFAARRAGPAIAAMPEWREPLRRAREFATLVDARWWLEQLPEPRS
jgi:tetratricopeptide (TPR) repeat protein